MEIRAIRASEGDLLREISLKSLRDAPHAFGGPESYAEEEARPLAEWHDLAAELAGEVPAWRDRCIGYFAVDGDAICGKAICYFGKKDPAYALFSGVWIDREHRRRGIGRQLMLRATAWAVAHGAARLKLWVDDANSEGVAFYRALGFQQDGGSRPVSPNSVAIERSMCRNLTGA